MHRAAAAAAAAAAPVQPWPRQSTHRHNCVGVCDCARVYVACVQNLNKESNEEQQELADA